MSPYYFWLSRPQKEFKARGHGRARLYRGFGRETICYYQCELFSDLKWFMGLFELSPSLEVAEMFKKGMELDDRENSRYFIVFDENLWDSGEASWMRTEFVLIFYSKEERDRCLLEIKTMMRREWVVGLL